MKRIVLKLSGEVLANKKDGIYDMSFVDRVAASIKAAADEGYEIALVVGAGNIWRGREGGKMNRVRADHMGMLATTINALALQDTFVQCGIDAVAMTAVEMNVFAKFYTPRDAIEALSSGKVVVLGGGTGAPYFSTDTAAVLRAAEIEANAVLMAKNIDGVYSADPKKDPTAVKYDEITYTEMISKELGALDLTAAAFCMANDITSYAFELKDPMNIYRVAMGEKIGTELHK